MFGIIHGLFVLFGSGYEHIRRSSVTTYLKNDAIKAAGEGRNISMTYSDWQGHTRDLLTGEKVVVYREKGHLIVEDLKGNIVRDITQEQKQKTFDLDMSSGKTAIKILNSRLDYDKEWEKRTGKNEFVYYKDIEPIYVHCKTKRYCVSRSINFNCLYDISLNKIELIKGAENSGYHYLVDIHTGEIIEKDYDFLGKFIPQIINEDGSKRNMTLKEELEGIRKYNELIRTKKINSKKNKLAEVLPLFFDKL